MEGAIAAHVNYFRIGVENVITSPDNGHKAAFRSAVVNAHVP